MTVKIRDYIGRRACIVVEPDGAGILTDSTTDV